LRKIASRCAKPHQPTKSRNDGLAKRLIPDAIHQSMTLHFFDCACSANKIGDQGTRETRKRARAATGSYVTAANSAGSGDDAVTFANTTIAGSQSWEEASNSRL
jgi:hypothetical protein